MNGLLQSIFRKPEKQTLSQLRIVLSEKVLFEPGVWSLKTPFYCLLNNISLFANTKKLKNKHTNYVHTNKQNKTNKQTKLHTWGSLYQDLEKQNKANKPKQNKTKTKLKKKENL